MNDIERQKQIESDTVSDGAVRWAQSVEYQLASDTKRTRDLMGTSLKSLADAIRAEQDALKSSRGAKLPKYEVPLLSLGHQEIGLITLGMLFNSISRSEFEECVAPRVTPVAYDIGQRCRLERMHALLRGREVNVADELRCRNRSGHAGRRAAELARKLDDGDDWTKNYRSYHLGEKLIALAIRHAEFDGQPVFEAQETLTLVLNLQRLFSLPEGTPTLVTIANIGWLRLQQGRFPEAEKTFREAAEILRRTAAGTGERFSVDSMLGAALAAQRKFEEAEPLLISGYDGMRRTQPNAAAFYGFTQSQAGEAIVQLYTDWMRPDRRAEWTEKLKADRNATSPPKP